MKNLLIGLFFIGLTTLGFSQQKNGKVEQVKLKDVIVTNTLPDVSIININYSYLNKVQDRTTSKHVKLLESVASRFNVMDSPQFDGRQNSFKCIFKGTKGYIVATYNSKGEILRTVERYRDIKIPKNMVKSILSQFPDSKFLKVVHTVNFSHDKNVMKRYKIRIMNDNSTKNLKITTIIGDYDNSYAITLEN